MRFNNINLYFGEPRVGARKKEITVLIRNESNRVCTGYLNVLNYYNNEQCKSLNISCDENINAIYVEPLWEGYPVLHYPFNFVQYLLLDSNENPLFWFKVIHESINYVGNLWGWDLQFFDKVYHKTCADLLK